MSMPSSIVGEQNRALMDLLRIFAWSGWVFFSSRNQSARKRSSRSARSSVLDVAGVVFGTEPFRRGEIAVHIPEEFVRAWSLLFVGPPLNGIGLDSFAVAEAPQNFVDAKSEDGHFLVLFAASRLLDEVVRSLRASASVAG